MTEHYVYQASNDEPKSWMQNEQEFFLLCPIPQPYYRISEGKGKTEAALIRQYMPDLLEEWQVALPEWKIENNVHNVTDYQARRVAEWVAGDSKK